MTITQQLVNNTNDYVWTEKVSNAHEFGYSLIVITWSKIRVMNREQF